MIDWDAMLSGGDMQPPAHIEAGQAAADQEANAPAALPGIGDPERAGDNRRRCAECGSTELRAPRVGVARTAEELGRAFPQTPVVQSSGEHRVAAPLCKQVRF